MFLPTSNPTSHPATTPTATPTAGSNACAGSVACTRRPRVLAAIGALVFGLGMGPCGPIPGGALPATTSKHQVADWSFANRSPHCVLEVGQERPRSVTLNCVAHEGSLFVSCSACAGKRWAAVALEDPRGRVKIADRISPVTITRVVDPERLDAVWRARARKLGQDESTARKPGWWTFELRSR